MSDDNILARTTHTLAVLYRTIFSVARGNLQPCHQPCLLARITSTPRKGGGAGFIELF